MMAQDPELMADVERRIAVGSTAERAVYDAFAVLPGAAGRGRRVPGRAGRRPGRRAEPDRGAAAGRADAGRAGQRRAVRADRAGPGARRHGAARPGAGARLRDRGGRADQPQRDPRPRAGGAGRGGAAGRRSSWPGHAGRGGRQHRRGLRRAGRRRSGPSCARPRRERKAALARLVGSGRDLRRARGAAAGEHRRSGGRAGRACEAGPRAWGCSVPSSCSWTTAAGAVGGEAGRGVPRRCWRRSPRGGSWCGCWTRARTSRWTS